MATESKYYIIVEFPDEKSAEATIQINGLSPAQMAIVAKLAEMQCNMMIGSLLASKMQSLIVTPASMGRRGG